MTNFTNHEEKNQTYLAKWKQMTQQISEILDVTCEPCPEGIRLIDNRQKLYENHVAEIPFWLAKRIAEETVFE